MNGCLNSAAQLKENSPLKHNQKHLILGAFDFIKVQSL